MVLVIGPRAKATWTTRKYDKPQDEDVDLPGSRAGINGTLLTPLQVTRPKISPSVRSVGVTENPGSTWHQAEGQSHNKMFIMECGGLERLAGPAEAWWATGNRNYSALQDGWANTMGLFLAQRENTAFSVMKRWALRGACSCKRYI